MTDAPIITKTKAIMAGRKDVVSLAQGIVHWQPPEEALAAAADAIKAPLQSNINQLQPHSITHPPALGWESLSAPREPVGITSAAQKG